MYKINQVKEITITQCFLFKICCIKIKFTPLMPFSFSQNMLLIFNWYNPYNREKACRENPSREKSNNFLTSVANRPTLFLRLCIKALFIWHKVQTCTFSKLCIFNISNVLLLLVIIIKLTHFLQKYQKQQIFIFKIQITHERSHSLAPLFSS